ncbi:damage-inducible protein, partial [Corynebacterium sp. 35RC1]|nr:damage-inducible protein [Corynebacterium sp. 35RC1]
AQEAQSAPQHARKQHRRSKTEALHTPNNLTHGVDNLYRNTPPQYSPFNNIALADTFQIHEEGDIPDLMVFKENNATIQRQMEAPINVVIGNPPYSAGQTSANDLNANLKYPSLDARIAETYAAKSTATNKNSLYDSYLRAFRWATDRIGDKGIVAFVSNNGWIDGNTGGGIRLSLVEDFTDLYVLNLRGNSRTAGDIAKREGGNVFDIRVGVSILIGVKDPTKDRTTINYVEAADYMNKDEKIALVAQSTVENLCWQQITPNQWGDWLNQRTEDFETWPVIGEKKGQTDRFFSTFSAGLKTGRDAWAYAQTPEQLTEQLQRMLDTYNDVTEKLARWAENEGITRIREAEVTRFLQAQPDLADSTKISWNRTLKNYAAKGTDIRLKKQRIYRSLYRPFTGYWAYFDGPLNDMTYQLPSIFPTPRHKNTGFYIVNPGSAKPFSAIATDLIPDLAMWGSNAGQFFPRFTWQPVDAADGSLFGAVDVGKLGEQSEYEQVGEVVDRYVRVDNITDEIKELYRSALGADITGDDIFHFVYGKLHDPNYRSTYAADLKKMLPHIETPASRAEFDKFAAAGAALMKLHVGYEDVEPWPVTVEVKGDEADRETWRVLKMKWAKRKDPETGKSVNDVTKLIYNKYVTVSDIPAEAEEYMLGSRSALAWIIDRYQVKKDKASGIVNDPNDWADEVGNPRYIVDLIAKVTRVAVETVRIVDSLGDETEV